MKNIHHREQLLQEQETAQHNKPTPPHAKEPHV